MPLNFREPAYENIRYATTEELIQLSFEQIDALMSEAAAKQADATKILNWLKVIRFEKSNGALKAAHRKAGGADESR